MERIKIKKDVNEGEFWNAADAYDKTNAVHSSTITLRAKRPGVYQSTADSVGTDNELLKIMEMRIWEEALRMGGIAVSSNEPYTCFVPTDKAISTFPGGTKRPLISSPKQMFEVLKYHCVKGKLSSKDILEMKKIATLEGHELAIDRSGGGMINGARIVYSDIDTGNGMIHVIDDVLIP
jgi:uncharacterized surface protein with fasciclin (FAS1) repeats